MLDWLIIGGGIHGVHLAHVLVHGQGFPADTVRILDPHDHLLAVWSRRTANTGMRYLRSTSVHHIGLEPDALRKFASEQGFDSPDAWINPYSRPSYTLFQQHCQQVINTYQLDHLHIPGQAHALHQVKGGWRVETSSAGLTTRRVMLATGRQQLHIPGWAEPLMQNAPIQHVLDAAFERRRIAAGAEVTVVGGGISAGQIALSLLDDHAVSLVTRQPLRQYDFDTSPCWIGPACLRAFHAADYPRRRWMIDEARQPGTLASDIYTDVQTAIQSGGIHHHQGEIIGAQRTADNRIRLVFADGTEHAADYAILATGLRAIPPGQTWLADAIKRCRLPVARCGYPILDQMLRWAKGLYVSGPLAELELGPVSANIVGARAAARRLRHIRPVGKRAR